MVFTRSAFKSFMTMLLLSSFVATTIAQFEEPSFSCQVNDGQGGVLALPRPPFCRDGRIPICRRNGRAHCQGGGRVHLRDGDTCIGAVTCSFPQPNPPQNQDQFSCQGSWIEAPICDDNQRATCGSDGKAYCPGSGTFRYVGKVCRGNRQLTCTPARRLGYF